MNPGAPTQSVFMISPLFALIGVLAALIVIFTPVAAVWIVAIASIVLAVICGA